jgi:hypothetical protein
LIDLQKTIDKFQNRLIYNLEQNIDITGDGDKEKFLMTLKADDKYAIVKNQIFKNNKVIWADSILIDNKAWYYLEDSIFFDLLPYSSFYLGYKYFQDYIVEKPSNYYDDMTEIIKYQKDYGENSKYWDNIAIGFSGYLIGKLSLAIEIFTFGIKRLVVLYYIGHHDFN